MLKVRMNGEAKISAVWAVPDCGFARSDYPKGVSVGRSPAMDGSNACHQIARMQGLPCT